MFLGKEQGHSEKIAQEIKIIKDSTPKTKEEALRYLERFIGGRASTNEEKKIVDEFFLGQFDKSAEKSKLKDAKKKSD